jgi:dynein heavy chain
VEKEKTGVLIEEVGRESNIAEGEERQAKEQEDATNVVANEAKAAKAAADKELEAAIPAMERAAEAVNCLTPKAIQEFKSYTSVKPEVQAVTDACLILLGEKQRSRLTWPAGQKMMNPPATFLQKLTTYDKDNIPDWALAELEPILAQPTMNKAAMMQKSEAAANLCSFVVNVVAYNKIYRVVRPLMEGAAAAEALAAEKMEELAVVQERVAEIVAKVNALKANLQAAEDKKAAVVAEAERLQSNLDLAGRLVGGLADENVRWKNNVQTF